MTMEISNVICQNVNTMEIYNVILGKSSSFEWNGNQQREYTFISSKYEHLRINQIQLRFLHFNEHPITLLGIHMCHCAYKREKYTFISRVFPTSLAI